MAYMVRSVPVAREFFQGGARGLEIRRRGSGVVRRNP